jgi:3-methyladenine DNA glycosylase/8-oxoguanine DNA glycosylase
MDGLLRVRRGVLKRLLHLEGDPVVVAVGQPSPDRVLFAAEARDRPAAEWGIERMRRALGVDQDLRPFYDRFRDDRMIGPSVRLHPWLRVRGKPEPFEALAWAVCEQLIALEDAAAIERQIVAIFGRRCAQTGLRDAPSAQALADAAPARLCSFGLTNSRAVALVRVAREVALGRVNLYSSNEEAGWRRLRAIRGIGSWTLQMLALTGQGRLDQLPAGDLNYLKFVGRLRCGGDPWARATEEEVMELFAPYAPWAGLAGLHALRASSSSRISSGASEKPRRISVSSRKREGSLRPSQRTVKVSTPKGQGSTVSEPARSGPFARAAAELS